MSAETKTERVLRDVLNSDNLRDLLGEDAVNNAMKWRFLQAALYVLDGHGLLGDPDAVKVATPAPPLPTQDGDDDGREAAPLDPKSVHVGDTVTVRFIETGDVLTTKAYQPDDITASGEYVYLLGWPLHRANGTFGLAISHFEILAIEPAPEPEWEMTQVAVVTPHGKDDLTTRAIYGEDGNWHNAYGGFWSDDEVSVRPLVVIDPAAVDVVAIAKAMHQVDYPGLDFALNLDQSAYVAKARAALAHLGIEATS